MQEGKTRSNNKQQAPSAAPVQPPAGPPAPAPSKQTAVAVIDPAAGAPAIINEEDISAYLDAMGSKLLPVHKKQFVTLCRAYRLNPFLKEIYGVPYTDRDTGDTTFSIIVGYEVYLKRAERSGLLEYWEVTIGRDEPFGADARGELWAKILIKRKDRERPFTHEVYYNEYVQKRWDSASKTKVPTKFWAEKPRTMLKKVAMAQGFRLAFPIECGGMPYISEEIGDQYEVDDTDKAAAATVDSPFRRQPQAAPVSAEATGTAFTPPAAPARFDAPTAEPANFEENPPFDPDPPAPNSPTPETAANRPPSPAVSSPSNVTPTPATAQPAPIAAGSTAQTARTSAAPETASAQRLQFVINRFKDRGVDFDRFLVFKKWLPAGSCLMDLSEAQVERIFNNIDVMERAFNSFIESEKAAK